MAVLKSCGTKGNKLWLERLWRGEKMCLKRKHQLLAGKRCSFSLLLESLRNTAIWWLPSIALPTFYMQCDLVVLTALWKFCKGTAPLNEMYPKLLKVEHIISYLSCSAKCLVLKLCYSTSHCIRIIYLWAFIHSSNKLKVSCLGQTLS